MRRGAKIGLGDGSWSPGLVDAPAGLVASTAFLLSN
jgi:hypothetical protein